jgi:DNA polymerase
VNVFEAKDKRGKALIKLCCVPRKPTKANSELRLHPWSAPEDFAALYEYCQQDVRAEMWCAANMPEMHPRELAIWQIDQVINQRGMMLDVPAINACIVIVEQAFAKYNGEFRTLTGGAVEASTEVAATLRWMAGRGVELHELDEETVTEALKRDYPPDVLRVLKIRQMLAFGSVRKLYAMRAQVCRDGRLRDQYVYHGAHTGLWNGRDVQVANLYSGKLKTPEKIEAALASIRSGSLEYVELMHGDALETVADCLRSMIIAAPGHRLIMSDFSAIQAVVTSAIAGEKWRLDVFHGDGKIYEAQASILTGKTLQFYLDYKKQNGSHHPDRQTYGKIPVLASDFGAWIGGWKRFGAEAFGDDGAIKAMILKTRAKIPAIVELWGGQTRDKFNRAPDGSRGCERPELFGLEGAAIAAVEKPGTCYGYRAVRYLYDIGRDTLYCQPPGDGAPIQYHAPRLDTARREWASPWELDLTYEGWNSNATKGRPGWQRMGLYGGVLTQNVVSKTAREYQADALMAVEAAGYPVVAHTHDEIVTERKVGGGSVSEYLEIVGRGKPWAVDDWGRPWPVKVPGAEEAQRYAKYE